MACNIKNRALVFLASNCRDIDDVFQTGYIVRKLIKIIIKINKEKKRNTKSMAAV